MHLYCALDVKSKWKQEKETIKKRITEMTTKENFLSMIDESNYFPTNSLPEWIESLKITDTSTNEIHTCLFQWTENEKNESTELFSIQSLPTKKWKNSWDSVCIDESIKETCIDYISSIIRISKSNVDTSILSLNR